MNHPSPEWIDWNTFEIKDGYDLDINIRFVGLKARDSEDHEKCLWWEIYRTKIFKDESFENDEPNRFPFYVSSFPEKSYLEHDYKIRSKWRPVDDSEEIIDDLFEEISGTNYEVDHGICKSKILRERVPLVLQVNPKWGTEKLISLLRKQSATVSSKLESAKKELEKEGYIFDEQQKNPKHISTHKKNLKALGHYRISECMNLGWKYERYKKIYGASTYKSEKTFRENLLTYGENMIIMKGERFANAKSSGKPILIL